MHVNTRKKVIPKRCFCGDKTQVIRLSNLLCHFTEIPHQERCSPVYFFHIFRIPFPKKYSEGMLLREVFDPVECK